MAGKRGGGEGEGERAINEALRAGFPFPLAGGSGLPAGGRPIAFLPWDRVTPASAPAEAKGRSLALFITRLSSLAKESMNLDRSLCSCLFLQLYMAGEVTEEAGKRRAQRAYNSLAGES